HYIKSPDQVRLIPGAAAAVKRINDAKIPVIVVTNQSGIGRGMFTVKDYEAVREQFESLLAKHGAHVDASYYCPDHPSVSGPSICRKPATKMFEDAIRDFDLNPAKVAYVGDRWRDVAASRKLGGRGIMISSPMTTDEDRRKAEEDGIQTAPSLQDAVDVLFGLTEKDGPA
ncbi:MAG TPA: HAD-IIIA family hydrolase, partial [Gemmatimonadaceae bacterium]|nr:HAD-IIIA family hydrolase [Gemmatimonadaceae bacterium]